MVLASSLAVRISTFLLCLSKISDFSFVFEILKHFENVFYLFLSGLWPSKGHHRLSREKLRRTVFFRALEIENKSKLFWGAIRTAELLFVKFRCLIDFSTLLLTQPKGWQDT